MEMKKKEFFSYASPSFIVMVMLMIAPVALTFYLSVHSYTYGSSAEFVGIANYIEVLKSSRFWNATYFTLMLTVVTTAIKIIIGFIVAILLYNAKKFRGVFIAGSLLPFIVPPVVSTMIFGWLFRANWGYISYLLAQIGINIQWYSEPWSARWLIMMHIIWKGTPFVLLVLYSGLQAMPKQFLEAARVDGANYFQRIFYVIVPYLKPLFVFVSMIMIMDAYRIFDNVAVMTQGGPGTATESLMYYNYEIAFGRLSLGLGSAISVLTLFGIFALLVPFLYMTYLEQKNI
jgi:ABC-type sugar transport system permease subunit